MPNDITQELREALSAYAHEAWSGWIRYMFSKFTIKDGAVIVPAWAWERWSRQASTPYLQLPEIEKQSDREEADKMIAIFIGNPILDEEDYEPKTEAEIDAFLREAGYDPEEVSRMGVKVALMAMELSPIYPKNQQIAKLEAELAELKNKCQPG